VVSTHLKNISQIGSFPQVGMKINNIWNHHLVSCWTQGLEPSPKKSTNFREPVSESRTVLHFWVDDFPFPKGGYVHLPGGGKVLSQQGSLWKGFIESEPTSTKQQRYHHGLTRFHPKKPGDSSSPFLTAWKNINQKMLTSFCSWTFNRNLAKTSDKQKFWIFVLMLY